MRNTHYSAGQCRIAGGKRAVNMIYRFSDLIFDLDRRQLSRDGQPVKLTRLSFRVLRALVEAAPALVRHDDLITEVWGENRVITPENLIQRMKTLRRSLGDDAANPTYIEGVRGQGFRLIPAVTKLETAPHAPHPVAGTAQAPESKTELRQAPGRGSKRAWSLGLAGILAGLLIWFVIDSMSTVDNIPEIAPGSLTQADSSSANLSQRPAIAVLPFANLSEDPSNQYFTDGIHDDLLTRISNIQNIKTISRTSVMTYRDTNKKLGTIAEELGVNTILEGGVQRIGNQVRINLQLIDTRSDAHIWASTYTRELTATTVFAIQAEITEAVANALQTVLSEDERKQVEKLSTTNLQALDAYFMGNQYYDQATSEGVTKAIEAYQAAIELDPGFALAYSRQASAVLSQVWTSGLPAKAQLEMSRPLIDQAILLDPLSSEAFIALGDWYQRSGDTQKAFQAFEQAMALGPNNANALVSYGNLVLSEMSDPASAIKLLRRAIELDPQNIRLKRQLALALPSVGLAVEGIRIMEGIVAGHPDSAAGYRDLALLYSNWEFRHDKGIRALRRAFELDPNHPPNSYWNAIMHWRLGDYDNTALWMNHIAGLVPDHERAQVYRGWAFIAQRNFDSAREEFDRPHSGSSLYWLGVFYLGNVDLAEGRPEDAIERYKGYALEFDGRKTNVNFDYGVAAIKAYQALGEQEKAQALIDELMSAINASSSSTYHDSAIHNASIYALSGQVDAAIATLEEWANRGGATSLLQQDIRHGLDVLNGDPRYQSILRTVNKRLSEQKANLARWEANGEMLPIPEAVLKSSGSE
jgi:TolB-like protein/DNA-binding winged helix-turn-helix (wHTH) protein